MSRDEGHPETIYLLDMGDELTWCDDPTPDFDDRNPVEYIRADTVSARVAELESTAQNFLRELDELRMYPYEQTNNAGGAEDALRKAVADAS